ncbi:hypothetical protein TUMEXPCC7403_09845 [Tumidithrix helvetica PCC 7403]|uniref:CmcI family methyltransferase n=1 Tax=Tumidithrix helvetica TaxID=3457545 RepID=UPI003CA591F3
MMPSPPRIAIDGAIFQVSEVGEVSRIWHSLLMAWAKTDFAQNLLILNRGGTVPEVPSLQYSVIPLYDINNIEADRLMLQQVCDTEGIDLFISTDCTTPISTLSLSFIHNTISETFQSDLDEVVRKEKYRAIHQAYAYVAMSNYTARDLIRVFPHILPETITVAHCGVETLFKPATSDQIGQFQVKHQITKPYYLLVGENFPCKRYNTFFQAFSHLSNRQEFDIVWVGNRQGCPAEFRQLLIDTTLHELFLEDRELAIAYSGAIAFILPSHDKGFGLPLLEAIACGCPVITSYHASNPEVVGNAALYVDPDNTTEFTCLLLKVMETQIRNRLISQGMKQAEKFSWRNMADIFEEAILDIFIQKSDVQKSDTGIIQSKHKQKLPAKHILLSTSDLGVGGVGQYNHALLCYLQENGFQVTCLQLSSFYGDLIDARLVQLQEEIRINHVWLRFDDSDKHYKFITNAPKIDLIICSDSGPFSNLTIKNIAIDENIPFILVEGLVEEINLTQNMDREILGIVSNQFTKAKEIVAVSAHNLALLHNFYGLPHTKGKVVYYGRPKEYFDAVDRSIRDKLREELKIPPQSIVCFTSARIEKRKGYQYLLESIKQIINTLDEKHLYFVWAGSSIFDPKLERCLREEIVSLQISDHIIFLGNVPNISEWLNIADIFVLPSKSEGMPLSIMEAMAKGLPVIATAVSGIPEEMGQSGILIADPNIHPDRTAAELGIEISRLASDLTKRQELGNAAKQRAEKMFTEKRMLEETMAIIDAALGNKKDYISPNLEIVYPDSCFPNMISGDTNNCDWQYLRREVPHHWYVDRRQPTIGFLSRDEAHILYNNALQFRGKLALEIGCWLGWSACHLALAGVQLDVIDPLLGRPDFFNSVQSSLTTAKVIDRVNLMSGYSPQKVEELAAEYQRKWSLIFIDGNHDAPYPLKDARICETLAEDNAMILFHDLASPDVSQGLEYFRERGWNTTIYQTMQIMGVAWRGNVEPVMHTPDPDVAWEIPIHLQHYNISGLENPDLAEFRELRSQVRPFTLLSEARLYSLYAETKRICLEDIEGDFVECGVFKGGASTLMAAVINRYSRRSRKLYAFDTFAGMPEPTDLDRHNGIPANDTPDGVGTLSAPIVENLSRIAKQLNVTEIIEPVQGLFADTLPIYVQKIVGIALLHADGDWYESTMDIFNNLYDLVIPNGMIQVDDYGHWEGCRVALHDFERLRNAHFDLRQIDYTGVSFHKPSQNNEDSAYWHTALPSSILNTVQSACFKYAYRGIPMQKNPFDFTLYPLLLWEVKPKTIIEIGSCSGGSAVWFADLLETYGIDAHIYSIDINQVTDVAHPHVTFLGCDQNHLESLLTHEFMQSLPRPLLVVEDGAHFYETTLAVLNFFHPYLQKGEYIVVEDGIISDLGADSAYRGGPCLALREFLSAHLSEYVIDRKYCDFFGQNVTWNINGYLRKIKDGTALTSPPSQFVLRSQNLIAFVDWSKSNELIYEEMRRLVARVLGSPHAGKISLFLYAKGMELEKVDEILAEVVMEWLMESNTSVETEPHISILSDLKAADWEFLAAKGLQRIEIQNEASDALVSLPITLLSDTLEHLVNHA